MEKATQTAVFITSLLLANGYALAAESSQGSVPVDKTTNSAPTSSSTNQMEEQDLSDKEMQASEKGAATETIRMGFKRLDANDDSAITLEEASVQPPLNTEFKTLDQNGDQKLDMKEYAQFVDASSESILTEQNKPSAAGTPKAGTPAR